MPLSSFSVSGDFLYTVVNGIFSSFRLDLPRWTAQATFSASLTVAAYDEMQADKACNYLGVSSFAVAAVEYTPAVILHILLVDRDDKGTG